MLRTYEGKLKITQMYAWSDSRAALSWIKSSPHLRKTFVSNRVSYIQERIAWLGLCFVRGKSRRLCFVQLNCGGMVLPGRP